MKQILNKVLDFLETILVVLWVIVILVLQLFDVILLTILDYSVDNKFTRWSMSFSDKVYVWLSSKSSQILTGFTVFVCCFVLGGLLMSFSGSPTPYMGEGSFMDDLPMILYIATPFIILFLIFGVIIIKLLNKITGDSNLV